MPKAMSRDEKVKKIFSEAVIKLIQLGEFGFAYSILHVLWRQLSGVEGRVK